MSQARTVAPRHPRELPRGLGVLALFWVCLWAGDGLVGALTEGFVGAQWLRPIVGCTAVALLAMGVFVLRDVLWSTVRSLPFALALATALLCAAIVAAWPARLPPTLCLLGLDDVFHTAWFAGSATLLVASLVTRAVDRRVTRSGRQLAFSSAASSSKRQRSAS